MSSEPQVFRNLPNAGGSKPKGDEDLPEELKGKSPSEIFKTLQAEHIREMAETNQQYAQKLEQLALTPPPVPHTPAPPQQPAPQTADQIPSFEEDPERYLDAQVNRRVGPILQSVVQSGRIAGRELAKQKYAKDFEKYGAEIESFVDNVSPQMQANAGIYEIARNFVRGQHVDEIIEETTQSKLKDAVKTTLSEIGFDVGDVDQRLTDRERAAQPQTRPSLFSGRSVPPTSTPRAASAANGGPGKPKLSQAERAMCEKFNMTEEEYITYKAENSDILSTMGREGA